MRIMIGSDHAGFALKEKVIEKLLKDGYDVIDAGPETADRVDYPVYGAKVGRMVAEDGEARGCLLYTSPSPRDLAISRMPSSA